MVPEKSLQRAGEILGRKGDFGGDFGEAVGRISGDVVGVEERDGAGCLEVVEEGLLRFLDGFGPVLPWDFREGLSGGCGGEEE